MCIKVTMAYVCRCWRSESGTGSPGALVTGVYEPPDMGAGTVFGFYGKQQVLSTAESSLRLLKT